MGGRGGSSGVNSGIKKLQIATKKGSDSQLMSIYNKYGNANLRNLSNEEKMVRAVVTDELLSRGRLYDDRVTGEIFKAKPNENIVRYNDRSYKITKSWTVKIDDGKSYKMVEAQTLVNGKWAVVQGYDLRKAIAKKKRK